MEALVVCYTGLCRLTRYRLLYYTNILIFLRYNFKPSVFKYKDNLLFSLSKKKKKSQSLMLSIVSCMFSRRSVFMYSITNLSHPSPVLPYF